jgi:hypothetical protein
MRVSITLMAFPILLSRLSVARDATLNRTAGGTLEGGPLIEGAGKGPSI